MTNRIAFPYRATFALLAIATAASADPPNFRINEIFSSADGGTQFVELIQTSGWGEQQHFAGMTLTMTHNGVVKKYAFPHDLMPYQKAIVLLATTPVYVDDPDANRSCAPDYVIPFRFLATDGGTLEFAGADQVTYTSLPTDGQQGLYRNGVRKATLDYGCIPDFCFCSEPEPGRVGIGAGQITAVEYYDVARDHYFMTASAPDIDALDSGRIGGWQRTGLYFDVAAAFYPGFAPDANPVQPVCRFYIPPYEGDSHFFSAFSEECAQVRTQHPEYVLESDAAFYVRLPDATTGTCQWSVPVFRLWNQRADSNHRYTTNVFLRNRMLERGYVSEGYGPDAVAFCASSRSEFGDPGVPATMIEYYNAAQDHYFSTGNGYEIDLLDSGRIPEWQRTGWVFTAANLNAPDARLIQPLCRFYSPASDSHFYFASPKECPQVAAQHPEYVAEGNTAIFVSLPDEITGQCTPDQGLIPVFRLWNQRVDTNHRYVTNVFVRNLMIARGYLPQGFGPNGVAFCVPGGAA